MATRATDEERGGQVADENLRGQSGSRSGEHGDDHADHAGHGQERLPASAANSLDSQPLGGRDAEQMVNQSGAYWK